jgi:hypothetical protein
MTALAMSAIAGVSTTAFLLAVEVIPNRIEERIRNNEETALAMLDKIAEAEKEFRIMGIVDQDRDNLGEYGFLQELCATALPRGSQHRTIETFLDERLGRVGLNGVASYQGYKYIMYLPSTTGPTALAESKPLPPPEGRDADVQEKRFICFAWPVEHDRTGRRRFFITEEGKIYYSSGFVEGNRFYEATDVPPAHAPLVIGAPESTYADLSAPVADLSRREASCDGTVWEPLTR